ACRPTASYLRVGFGSCPTSYHPLKSWPLAQLPRQRRRWARSWTAHPRHPYDPTDFRLAEPPFGLGSGDSAGFAHSLPVPDPPPGPFPTGEGADLDRLASVPAQPLPYISLDL